ncbi:hypothetical protein A9A89_0338 [Bifidobacterium psychraerophilum DSM 22366]|uniref:Uncharacterized protein n=1 Tax=Bifidobacterium psychraerophilum TaxID=218140 RepID=A0A087CM02_9BIFI|nr:hypothetical protein BPSY_0180 [Bifidobacterium psychraerophilum]PKA94159.1 hypothetical protein A9A89_0338 [Bifidobacterium psychraerophilum DSM 22366]
MPSPRISPSPYGNQEIFSLLASLLKNQTRKLTLDTLIVKGETIVVGVAPRQTRSMTNQEQLLRSHAYACDATRMNDGEGTVCSF